MMKATHNSAMYRGTPPLSYGSRVSRSSCSTNGSSAAGWSCSDAASLILLLLLQELVLAALHFLELAGEQETGGQTQPPAADDEIHGDADVEGAGEIRARQGVDELGDLVGERDAAQHDAQNEGPDDEPPRSAILPHFRTSRLACRASTSGVAQLPSHCMYVMTDRPIALGVSPSKNQG